MSLAFPCFINLNFYLLGSFKMVFYVSLMQFYYTFGLTYPQPQGGHCTVLSRMPRPHCCLQSHLPRVLVLDNHRPALSVRASLLFQECYRDKNHTFGGWLSSLSIRPLGVCVSNLLLSLVSAHCVGGPSLFLHSPLKKH